MQNQKVHEYEVTAGPNGLPVAQLTRTHNLITFVKGGSEKVHFLNGRWVDDGGNPLEDAAIPQDYKAAVEALPFAPKGIREADILVNCEFCEWIGPRLDYAKHLSQKHIVARSGTALPGADTLVDAPARVRPEDLPAGDYALDEEGYVILNKDGSPRKRAGRPRSDD